MDRVFVTSSNVRTVGYDPETLTLEVEFITVAGGEPRIYRYTPVAPEYYEDIVDPANSAGKLVGALRRDSAIACERVEPVNATELVATTEEF